MRPHLALFAMLFISSLPSAMAQSLVVYPKSVDRGKSSTLTWDTGGKDGYIVGYGKVKGRGSKSLTLQSNQSFIMVVEADHGYRYLTVDLVIDGPRGDDDDGFPSLANFNASVDGEHGGLAYLDFQLAVWKSLQQTGFSVRGDYVPGRQYVTFYTNFILRPDLVAADEQIRNRRIALAIEIDEPKSKNTSIHFSVKPILQFLYRGEEKWKTDRQSQLAQAEANKELSFLVTLR